MVMIGGSADTDDSALLDWAYELGAFLGRERVVVLDGSVPGAPDAAAHGARDNGGVVIGFDRGHNPRYANPNATFSLLTGQDMLRSRAMVHAASGIILVGNGPGAAFELGVARESRKPLVSYSSWQFRNGDPTALHPHVPTVGRPEDVLHALFGPDLTGLRRAESIDIPDKKKHKFLTVISDWDNAAGPHHAARNVAMTERAAYRIGHYAARLGWTILTDGVSPTAEHAAKGAKAAGGRSIAITRSGTFGVHEDHTFAIPTGLGVAAEHILINAADALIGIGDGDRIIAAEGLMRRPSPRKRSVVTLGGPSIVETDLDVFDAETEFPNAANVEAALQIIGRDLDLPLELFPRAPVERDRGLTDGAIGAA